MDLTLREVLERYGPTIGLIVALVLLVAIFPTHRNAENASELSPGQTSVEGVDEEGLESTEGGSGGGSGTSASGATGGASTGSGAAGGSGAIASGGGSGSAGPKVCRKEDGRQPGIARHMPPCVALFTGDNGGATARGVTATQVTVIRYRPQVSAATQAALIAAGADDDDETQDRMDAATHDYFAWHFETYKREVKFITMEATGESDDVTAMRADAGTIVNKHKAFAVFNAPTTLADELAARGVICICTTSLSDRFYAKHKGRIFSSLPSGEEYVNAITEYIGKRLKGRLAKWAGVGRQNLPRKFALVYQEASSAGPVRNAKDVADHWVNRMRSFGITNVKTIGYNSDVPEAQEQSRNVVTQLSDFGATSVVFLGDPLFPITMTKRATAAGYFPEWIITGTQLTDTTFFGRTYDAGQWSHAFGISPLWVFWIDVAKSSGYREYHHARPGSNRGDEGVSINVRRSPIQWVFLGIHMAGPKLTPDSFAQGMYNFPKTGGSPDAPLVFFTAERPNAIKDFTEVWWDPAGSGRDETGKDGPGTMVKVDGGKRYLTGSWPTNEPKVFNRAGSVYTKDPPVFQHEQDGHKHDPKKKCLSC